MSTLIWGRLDAATASGLSVSLPEACRLSDALLSQLRVKLGLDPSGARSPNVFGSCAPDGTHPRPDRPGAGGTGQQQPHSSSRGCRAAEGDRRERQAAAAMLRDRWDRWKSKPPPSNAI
jgi:hypothetical protein